MPFNNLPDRVALAHLPTPIETLNLPDLPSGLQLYLKRDDYTGLELSGNKVRKLEFAIAEALSLGAQVLITCGGIQSNHARATVAAARRLGLKVHLVLRSESQPPLEGNHLIDQVFGADITYLEPAVFNATYLEVMDALKATYDKAGTPAYILPIGASNAIGNFGYAHAYHEILQQERQLGIHFDAIVCTVGSGGTYGGLYLGQLLHGQKRRIIGYSISSTADQFKIDISRIVNESLMVLGKTPEVDPSDLEIHDGFAGLGYALSQPEEIAFIKKVAHDTGVLLDPVYTGKAFRGLIQELQADHFPGLKNILFIHTGGQFGFVPSYLK